MRICENGVYRDMTADEITEFEKLLRNPAIRAMFERYGVGTEK